jgi:hypothetical protein
MATLEDLERDGIELTVACTTGWKNMVIDEQEIPFSVENARKVYTQYTWIREQVDGFVNDRANFLPKAANA